MSDWKFETKQIHSGAAPDPVTNAREMLRNHALPPATARMLVSFPW